MKIDVVGGGPAGTYSAYLLAKKGYIVNLYERNPVFGPPVQCTGILSDHFTSIMPAKEDFVENVVEKTRIYAPNGRYVETNIKKNYVVCRKKFDNYLAEMAQNEGVRCHLGHSFNDFLDKDNLKVKLKYKGKAVYSSPDKLIGADGPLSPIAKAAGLYGKRQHLIGTQIEAKMENDNVVEFYPYIGSYAWIVPKDENTVRIGVAAYKDSMNLFKKFAKEKIGKDYDAKTIENQSGVIPTFNPSVKVQKGDIYLNGDAATFVKATTGGGINQSLKGAKILAESIDKNKDYNKEWKKGLYRNLHTHLVVHKAMQKFNENDWNSLINTFSEDKMKNILYSESRDNIVKMVSKIAMTKPSIFRYSVKFPFSEIKNFVKLS